MEIKFSNRAECNAMSTIISEYERLRDIEKREDDVSFSKVIDNIKNTLDSFYINQNIGKIGTVKCRMCSNEWTAVCAEDAKNVKCPSCGSVNSVQKGRG